MPQWFDVQSLEIGRCYFLVGYYDGAGQIPEIETYIYLGKNIINDGDPTDAYYFQDPEMYLKFGAFHENLPPQDYGLVTMDHDAVEAGIKDFDALYEWLEEVKARN